MSLTRYSAPAMITPNKKPPGRQPATKRASALALLVLLLSYFLAFSAPAQTQNTPTNPRQLTFTSSKATIHTEWFAPATTKKNSPIIIILHGSGGIEPQGGFFREVARQ